jgi:hypothetical protein
MEHEVWGLFPDQETFESYLSKFIKQYGEPKEKSRLSISFWDPNVENDVDTRIRITNGDAELMQKVGKWQKQDRLQMQEIDIPLPNDVDFIFNMYRVLRNNIPLTTSPKIIQYRNKLFDTGDYEIKLSEQHGNTTKYTFEVECMNDGEHLLEFVDEINLKQYILKTDPDFWVKWDKEVNLFTDELEEEELKKIIKDYLYAF